ncbi:MAG: hypothetical protein K5886_04095 [Lachnospiraceae bacterium]|nr:hypothetical protein [Lachnospiraceae bacterium]
MKKIIITLSSALLAVMTVVILKNICTPYIPIHNRGIGAAVREGDLDILFLGSSTFRCNIDMEAMDEAYDGRVFDISYGGNQCVANSIQYDEIKKRGKGNCKLMVFELGPLMITEDVMLTDSRVIWDLTFEGKKALWEKMKNSGNTDLPMMYEYFVTSGLDDLFTYPLTEPVYATRYYKGVKTEKTVSPGREYLDNESFDISSAQIVEAQTEAVKELMEKCDRDGQDYIFIETPPYKRLYEDPVYQKYRTEFIKILDEHGADHILAADVDYDNSDPDNYEDMNHMSHKGRQEYTKELIKELKKYR